MSERAKYSGALNLGVVGALNIKKANTWGMSRSLILENA